MDFHELYQNITLDCDGGDLIDIPVSQVEDRERLNPLQG